MDRKNRYKKMMEQIEPERELTAEDLIQSSAVRKRSAGRYLLVLVPAALAVIAALVLARGLFNGKTPEGTFVPVAVSDETEKTTPERPSDKDESIPAGAETETTAAKEEETEPPIIIVDKKQQAVGAVRLYYDQMEKDLRANTTKAFMEKYPETGEAYLKYDEYLHSGNPRFNAEMVYAWFTPGHPEEKDGDYLLLGIRIRTDIQGPYDSLNDGKQPDEGTDTGSRGIHGWAYILNYLYHFDELSGTLVPVKYPGEQIYLCRDFSLLGVGGGTEWHTEDGRVLSPEEMMPYYDENFVPTIPISAYRQKQTESYFSIDEAGEIVIEGRYVILDITVDYKTGEAGPDLADGAAREAAGVMRAAHGPMEPLTEEELVTWQVLSES